MGGVSSWIQNKKNPRFGGDFFLLLSNWSFAPLNQEIKSQRRWGGGLGPPVPLNWHITSKLHFEIKNIWLKHAEVIIQVPVPKTSKSPEICENINAASQILATPVLTLLWIWFEKLWTYWAYCTYRSLICWVVFPLSGMMVAMASNTISGGNSSSLALLPGIQKFKLKKQSYYRPLLSLENKTAI